MKSFFNIFILMVFSTSFLTAKEINKKFNHTFDVKPGAVLFLEHGDGKVIIESWEKETVQVDVKYHVESHSVGVGGDRDFDVEFKQNGEKVYIIGHEGRRINVGFSSINYIEYTYKIKVPDYIELDTYGDDGDLEIKNITGRIRCKLDDGEIKLENINNKRTDLRTEDGNIRLDTFSGELSVRSDDGDVHINNASVGEADITGSDGRIRINNSDGDFYVNSDDGDITLNKISGKKLDVKAQDADVDIHFVGQGEVSIGVKTNDGRVKLEFDNPVSAAFSLETDDGRIRFDIDDAEIIRETKRFIKGDLGAGEGKIVIRTNDGSITMSDAF
jgi:DUF4097 and DUF4098 domain-containing protein YvlB